MYSPAEAAFLQLQRTAGRLMTGVETALKPYGLTHTQYNVLRILRGAGPEGRPCGEIAGDMIHRDADMTRLLDRLEKQGWVERSRSTEDRRVVTARVTRAGLKLLGQLDAPVTAAAEGAMGSLTPAQLERLVNLLGRLSIS
jgi:DNA-binding MarR family transcriptional regulator